jgi:delta 1-pyrroline-5-carboxylate dehydrogenase
MILYTGKDAALIRQAYPHIPVLVDHYPCYRLVSEHTVSINIAAAGGNAQLMSLNEGDNT